MWSVGQNRFVGDAKRSQNSYPIEKGLLFNPKPLGIGNKIPISIPERIKINMFEISLAFNMGSAFLLDHQLTVHPTNSFKAPKPLVKQLCPLTSFFSSGVCGPLAQAKRRSRESVQGSSDDPSRTRESSASHGRGTTHTSSWSTSMRGLPIAASLET